MTSGKRLRRLFHFPELSLQASSQKETAGEKVLVLKPRKVTARYAPMFRNLDLLSCLRPVPCNDALQRAPDEA